MTPAGYVAVVASRCAQTCSNSLSIDGFEYLSRKPKPRSCAFAGTAPGSSQQIVPRRCRINRDGAQRILHRISSSATVSTAAQSSSPPVALDFVGWHHRLSAELFLIVGFVEIAVRSAVHTAMSDWSLQKFGSTNWFEYVEKRWEDRARRELATARDRIATKGIECSADEMVRELNFGFWRYMLAVRYQTIFWPIICRRMVGVPPGSERHLFRRIGRIHDLRNRIAHHEPIFGRRLDLDHRDCLLVLGAICPVTAQWVESQSRVPEVLAARPRL